MTARIFNAQTMSNAQVKEVAHALDSGAVAVFPTDTVYGIGCSALCPQAVEKIYTLKERPSAQPLQILVAGAQAAQKVAKFSDGAMRLVHKFWPGALTLILPPTAKGKPLTRGAKGIGLRVPDYTILLKILQNMEGPLCSTSANLHGSPVLTEEKSLQKLFGAHADSIIKGGTLSPVASSVVDLTDEKNPRLLREGCVTQAQLAQTLGQDLKREDL